MGSRFSRLALAFSALLGFSLAFSPQMHTYGKELLGAREIVKLPYLVEPQDDCFCGPFFYGPKGPHMPNDVVSFTIKEWPSFMRDASYAKPFSFFKRNITVRTDDLLTAPHADVWYDGEEWHADITLSVSDHDRFLCLRLLWK